MKKRFLRQWLPWCGIDGPVDNRSFVSALQGLRDHVLEHLSSNTDEETATQRAWSLRDTILLRLGFSFPM